jgi:proline iminopeptidase
MTPLAAALLGAVLGFPAATPSSEGYVTVVPGVRLQFQKFGTGSQWIVSPMASWLAEPLMPLATSRSDRTLLLYDTRGRARSDRVDPSKVSFENELSDLEAIRKHFNLDKMVLIGWSHYGMMVTVYATRHPERVQRIVAITPGGPRSDPYLRQGMDTIRSRVDGTKYQELLDKKKAGAFDRDPEGYCRALNAVTRPAFFGDPAGIERMTFDDCAFETEWPDNQEKWWGALFTSMTPWDYREKARALSMPRLIIQGGKDFIPIEGSREWAEGNPNARLLVIPGVGHHPFVEKAPVFLAAVETFLAGRWPEGAEQVEGAAVAKPTTADESASARGFVLSFAPSRVGL